MCQACGAYPGCGAWERPAGGPADAGEAIAALAAGLGGWRAAAAGGVDLNELRTVLAADLDGLRDAVGILARLTGL
jgi:hypothetical protein